MIKSKLSKVFRAFNTLLDKIEGSHLSDEHLHGCETIDSIDPDLFNDLVKRVNADLDCTFTPFNASRTLFFVKYNDTNKMEYMRSAMYTENEMYRKLLKNELDKLMETE